MYVQHCVYTACILRIRCTLYTHCVYTAQAATGISDVDELVTTFINAKVREYVSIRTSELST